LLIIINLAISALILVLHNKKLKINAN